MAGITLAQAQAQLDLWLDASTAVAGSQSYTMGERSLTRANLKEIDAAIDKWNLRVRQLSRGGIGLRLGVPG